MPGHVRGLQVLRCRAVKAWVELVEALRWWVVNGVSTGLLAALVACSSQPIRADTPLIRAEDGRSNLAKSKTLSRIGSGARGVPLSRGHGSGPATIARYIVDGIVRAGPGRLLQLVPLDPLFDARRRFRGFRIARVYDNSPRVLRYGVHPGDELVSINGLKILRPTHMLALFKLLPHAAELHIVVRRAGTVVHVRVPIADGDDAARSSSMSIRAGPP
jgi:hypothetical protein